MRHMKYIGLLFKGKNKKKYVIYRHICNKLKKIKIRPWYEIMRLKTNNLKGDYPICTSTSFEISIRALMMLIHTGPFTQILYNMLEEYACL